MKFSLLTIVAPRSPSSRATYAPAKPPPTTRTPPRASLVALTCPSIAQRWRSRSRSSAAEPSTRRMPSRSGGMTIGILPGETRMDGNPWLDHVVVTGIGHGRNLAVVASGDAVIAVGGRYGTLAEIGFALTLGRSVVVLKP